MDEHWACAPPCYLLVYFCSSISTECDNTPFLLNVTCASWGYQCYNIFVLLIFLNAWNAEGQRTSWARWKSLPWAGRREYGASVLRSDTGGVNTVGYRRCEYGGIRAVCQGIIGGTPVHPHPISSFLAHYSVDSTVECGPHWKTTAWPPTCDKADGDGAAAE